MIKKTALITLSLLAFFLFVFAVSKTNNSESSFRLLTTQKTFVAGKPIMISFSTNTKNAAANLFIIHSYGKTMLQSKTNKGQLRFTLPPNYSLKTGNVSWYLIQNNKQISTGDFKIIPNNQTPTVLENYLGPPSILTGKSNFTMMVAIPTDSYDNPKEDNTTVLIRNQFLDAIATEIKKTKSFIAWDNIHSTTKAGRMLISTECEQTDSKEFEADVLPNIATNFTIGYSRNHKFADGNQITKLETSVIKDQYGNVVSDGTLVDFQIITKNNIQLKTYATTINGIAIAQILHPDHEETYTVKGFITGIAKSNPIQIRYNALLNHFPYTFSEKNRMITVGPLKSFMQQIVPDGIKVELKIFHQNKLIETKIAESTKGIASFYLSPPFYKEKEYQFKIATLGVTKKTEIKKYETN
jgi:hypothetical protein